jgi:uncharacterized paraquat-inducible protein A
MELHRHHLEAEVRRQGLPVRDGCVDLDAEQTTCPACLHTFAPKGHSRCPDCGLAFR